MTRQGGFSPKIEDSVFRAYPNHGRDRGMVPIQLSVPALSMSTSAVERLATHTISC